MTNQLDDDAHESMNEGRGLCRVLAVGVLLAVATVATATAVVAGCALLDRAVERIRAALDKPDDGGTVETPTAPPTNTVEYIVGAGMRQDLGAE